MPLSNPCIIRSSIEDFQLQSDGDFLLHLEKKLQATGLPEGLTNQILNLYQKYASMFARLHIMPTYEATCYRLSQCKNTSERDIQQCKAIFSAMCRDMYSKSLSRWADDLLTRAFIYCNPPAFGASSGRETVQQVFKKASIPILEDYFTNNQFPSRSEKLRLAKISEMTYKQIDIWFQNRRNRIGKKTKISLLPTQFRQHSFSLINADDNSLTDPSSSSFTPMGKLSKENLTGQSKLDQKLFSFSVTVPAHAYPTIYPPAFDDDSFPCKSGSTRFSIHWLRKAATQKISKPDFTVAELGESFEKLSLGVLSDSLGDRDERKLRSDIYGQDKFNPIIVRPYPAPLPFLVRSSARRVNVYLDNCKSTKLHRQPRSQSKTGKKKRDYLPKRLPSMFHEYESFAFNDHLLEPCIIDPSSSRSPSVNSLPALSRCPSESSSSASSDSDSPLLSPAELHDDILNSFLHTDLFSLADFSPESIMSFPETTSQFDFSFAIPPYSLALEKDINLFS